MRRARRCSGQLVISCPDTEILPASTLNVPATALSSVDLPEPLVPSTMRNVPVGMVRDTFRSARTSFCVPPLNVFDIRSICSIGLGCFRQCASAESDSPREIGCHQRRKNKDGGNQLKIIRIEAPSQCNCH